MNLNHIFNPPFYLKNAMLQTILSSSKLRVLGENKMLDCTQELIIDAGRGVKLLGYISSHTAISSKGLVIFLHGWEGSTDSAYIISTGKYLYNNGFDIFRLNLRDHGDSHHLNKGLFLGTLIDEAFSAIKRIAGLSKRKPVYLIGFSMGANFAIRIAHRCGKTPIANLKHVVSINPPLDPLKATINIDQTRLIRAYFLKKWKRSLAIKQQLFPDMYDFNDILKMDTCMEMTEVLIKRYTEYKDAEDYFSHYTLKSGYLNKIKMPLTIITSEDDPVIPIEDFYSAKMSASVNFLPQKYGGHCGYIEGLSLSSWYQNLLVEILVP